MAKRKKSSKKLSPKQKLNQHIFLLKGMIANTENLQKKLDVDHLHTASSNYHMHLARHHLAEAINALKGNY